MLCPHLSFTSSLLILVLACDIFSPGLRLFFKKKKTGEHGSMISPLWGRGRRERRKRGRGVSGPGGDVVRGACHCHALVFRRPSCQS
jgi:hypothetical protein